MQEFKETYEKWRKMLLCTNIYLVLFVFVVEIIMYFILKKSNLILQPTPEYLMRFLIIPTIADSLIILVGYIMQKCISFDSKLVNYIPSVQQALICMVVASTHYIFYVIFSIFCIPLFTTVIFSDKKMTMHVGILSSIFLAIAFLVRKYDSYKPETDVYFMTEEIVAFVILIATIFICNVLIKFQKEKSNIIQQGYIRQLEMQEQLNKDQKTGLYGHTIFMNTLDQMVKLSESTNRKTTLAIIDIDDFKKVNDTYGHLKGDQVILTLVELMEKDYRLNQFMARFGGEEFAIIFTGSEADSAFDFLENLRIAFEKQRYSFMDDTITISIGIATWKSGCTSEELFNNADHAMYASKTCGKNRIKIYE